mmetsp:Transcript_45504/g.90211  ORF Transcript_45504/g.90211 Transcript_45504/m.90211 type:complete len:228 (+) Transcript_45504:329-1012(+)
MERHSAVKREQKQSIHRRAIGAHVRQVEVARHPLIFGAMPGLVEAGNVLACGTRRRNGLDVEVLSGNEVARLFTWQSPGEPSILKTAADLQLHWRDVDRPGVCDRLDEAGWLDAEPIGEGALQGPQRARLLCRGRESGGRQSGADASIRRRRLDGVLRGRNHRRGIGWRRERGRSREGGHWQRCRHLEGGARRRCLRGLESRGLGRERGLRRRLNCRRRSRGVRRFR